MFDQDGMNIQEVEEETVTIGKRTSEYEAERVQINNSRVVYPLCAQPGMITITEDDFTMKEENVEKYQEYLKDDMWEKRL